MNDATITKRCGADYRHVPHWHTGTPKRFWCDGKPEPKPTPKFEGSEEEAEIVRGVMGQGA